jgi:transcription initiation factor TFIID TATA-box-binding protein
MSGEGAGNLRVPDASQVASMTTIKIENVVATTLICKELDLQKTARALEGAHYDTDRFPGVVYRIKEPKTAMLLFRSGKVVCTGARSIADVGAAIAILARRIAAAGTPVVKKPEILVQNIVASADLGTVLNLNTIAITLGLDRVEYEPEQFPGLVYRLDTPKVVTLIFGSGKIVLTGARNTEDIEAAVKRIHEDLENAGLLAHG